MTNAIEKGKEIAESLIPTKEGLKSAVNSARDRIIGSGEIPTELKRFGGGYLSASKNIVGTPFKAIGEIVRLNPLEGLKELANGVKDLTSNIIDIGLSPVRGSVALGATAGKTAKKIVTAPVKGVLAITNAIGGKVKQSTRTVADAI